VNYKFRFGDKSTEIKSCDNIWDGDSAMPGLTIPDLDAPLYERLQSWAREQHKPCPLSRATFWLRPIARVTNTIRT
jgi:hypothetical protein